MGRRETKKRMGDLFNDVMLEDSADLIAGVDEAAAAACRPRGGRRRHP